MSSFECRVSCLGGKNGKEIKKLVALLEVSSRHSIEKKLTGKK